MMNERVKWNEWQVFASCTSRVSSTLCYSGGNKPTTALKCSTSLLRKALVIRISSYYFLDQCDSVCLYSSIQPTLPSNPQGCVPLRMLMPRLNIGYNDDDPDATPCSPCSLGIKMLRQ